MLIRWLTSLVDFLTGLAPQNSVFSVPNTMQGLLAVVLVCVICGAVGSLVVGNRMSFFSDALAHCAFAGVAIGMLVGLSINADKGSVYFRWGIPAVTVAFGMLVGLGIAYMKEKTVLANDTIDPQPPLESKR